MNNEKSLEQIQQELKTLEQQRGLQSDSRYMALHSIVKELAMREGLSEEEFQHHFDTRKRHYRDLFLRGVEDILPHRASELDDREPHDIPTQPDYPPIFP